MDQAVCQADSSADEEGTRSGPWGCGGWGHSRTDIIRRGTGSPVPSLQPRARRWDGSREATDLLRKQQNKGWNRHNRHDFYFRLNHQLHQQHQGPGLDRAYLSASSRRCQEQWECERKANAWGARAVLLVGRGGSNHFCKENKTWHTRAACYHIALAC